MGSRGRDFRWSTGKGSYPPKMVGSGKSERSSRVSEDKGTAHRHRRIPIAILGSNQCENYGRSVLAFGRATESSGSNSLNDRSISLNDRHQGRSQTESTTSFS